MTSRDPVQTTAPAHVEALAAQNAEAVNLFQVPEDIARGQCVLVSDEESADIERDFPPDIPLLMVMTTDVWCYDAPDQQRPNPLPAPRGAVFARVPQGTDQKGVELSTGRKVQYGDIIYDEPPLYNAWVCVRSGAREGWIFGAFLKTFQPHERPQMLRIRRRYISDGVETSYASTVMDMSPGATRGQMRPLTPAEREALQSQRRWSEPLSAQDVEISADYSDDFLKAYARIAALPQPLYITADLLLHMQHKLFQKLLIHFETEWLISGLGELLYRALSEATQRRAACAPALWGALDRARVVLTVAATLLGDEPAIDEALHPLVERELAAVNADGALPLWTTGQRPDGGWMQPRSHYTETEALSQYFKAMSYLSFCQFPLAARAQRPFPLPQLRGAPVSEQEALEGARVAAIMCLLWCADAALIRDHLAFDQALTTLFGRQDGLALATLSERERAALSWGDLLDEARVRSWAANLLRAHAPAQPPDQEDELYGSFGLMAQRPSLDGLLIELKNERLHAAPPSSAWLLAALGADAPQALTEASIEAPPLLTCADGTWRTQPLPKDPNATDQSLWETARARAESLTEAQWLTSYYQGMLGALRAVLDLPARTGAPWLDSDAARAARSVTALAAYAELKHDATLYNKLARLSMTGSAFRAPPFEYVADPEPIPPSYLEPNVALIVRLQSLCEHLVQSDLIEQLPSRWRVASHTMSEAGRGRAASPSRGYAYDILKTLKWFGAKLKSCAQIARRLQAFTPYQAGDAEFLRALPESLARVTGDSAGGWRNEKLPNHLRAALTSEAAIYAPDDKQPARFWNLATGIPQRVYMAVESPTEGKRVVVGVTFSAHEFYTWEHQRLNDDQWRALVYAPSPAPALTQTQVKPLSGSR